MTDNDSKARFEALETRLTHQEAALEELTHTLLRQEQHLRNHAQILAQLELKMRALVPVDSESAQDEKPPHY